MGYTYDHSEQFNSNDSYRADNTEHGSRSGSRLVRIRVWSHKYLHGIQLRYRKPKILMSV